AEAGPSDAPRLWFVTRAAQSVQGDEPPSIAQSPVWGLARVIGREHPKLRCSLVDLGAAAGQETISLAEELLADGSEEQVALRGAERYVARLVPRNTLEPASPMKRDLAEGQPFRLGVSTPGILDSLSWRKTARRKPAAGEI